MLALAVVMVGLPALASTVLADKRVALVIGNAAYEHTPKLNNATRDADAMAALFKRAGFEVVLEQTNVGNLEFKRSLRNFLLAAQDADIAVLFYSGH
ncbi:MAG TPA: caspase family protein, partial [Hyphomicrobiaceae bacterium]|nr:caspase family protein [Hyphomicrobiaceae bacterium]